MNKWFYRKSFHEERKHNNSNSNSKNKVFYRKSKISSWYSESIRDKENQHNSKRSSQTSPSHNVLSSQRYFFCFGQHIKSSDRYVDTYGSCYHNNENSNQEGKPNLRKRNIDISQQQTHKEKN